MKMYPDHVRPRWCLPESPPPPPRSEFAACPGAAAPSPPQAAETAHKHFSSGHMAAHLAPCTQTPADWSSVSPDSSTAAAGSSSSSQRLSRRSSDASAMSGVSSYGRYGSAASHAPSGASGASLMTLCLHMRAADLKQMPCMADVLSNISRSLLQTACDLQPLHMGCLLPAHLAAGSALWDMCHRQLSGHRQTSTACWQQLARLRCRQQALPQLPMQTCRRAEVLSLGQQRQLLMT